MRHVLRFDLGCGLPMPLPPLTPPYKRGELRNASTPGQARGTRALSVGQGKNSDMRCRRYNYKK